MTPQQISSPPAALAEVQVNENMSALGQGFLWAHDVTADTGLTVGLAGGTFDGNTVADTTVACTNNATNYIVVHRTTRAASVSTATTNWDDTTTYGRVARAVFASGVLTSFHDERQSVGGIFDHAAAAATGVSSVNGQTGAVVLDANDIGINDSDSLFAGATVEEALEQVGALLTSAVTSVNGQSGAVTIDAGDIGIADSNSTFAGATVEEALEELGAAVDGPEIVTITYAATITVALAGKRDNAIFRCTLTGDVTVEVSGGTDGKRFILELTQDGTGSRLVTLSGTYFRFGTDITSFTATTTASKMDRVGCIYNSTAGKADVVATAKGF